MDVPQAPPMSYEVDGDGGGGHDSDDSDVCIVGSSSIADQRPRHGQSTPPTPPPPSTYLDSIGAAYSQPLNRVQPFVCEANTPYQLQMRPTPVMTMPTSTPTMMSSRRTTSDHHPPSAASPVTWFSPPFQQQSYSWDVVGNGATSATDHGHHQP
jgi:hypothetical protein